MPFDGVDFLKAPEVQKADAFVEMLATPAKWCKGALRSHDGRYCIRGAIRALDAAELLEPVVLEVIKEKISPRFRRIESFNDHPDTSHAQVLAVAVGVREKIVARFAPLPASPPSRLASVFAFLVTVRLALPF